MADKIDSYTPLSYLRYRFYTIIAPWLFFLFLMVGVELFQFVPSGKAASANIYTMVKLGAILLKGAVFHAAYWFIPVSMFSAVLLVALKRHIGKRWLAITLAILTLFYCINLYLAWLPVQHTMAILGYVFFMWLGIFFKTHIFIIKYVLDNTPITILCFGLFIVFWLSCAEAISLKHVGCADAYASLRLSNAQLSIVLFLLLFKWNGLGFISKINPQKKTYGIYLVHSVIVMQLVPYAQRFTARYHSDISLLQLVGIQVLFFIAVFSVTIIVVAVVRRSALRFVFGIPKSPKHKLGIILPNFQTKSTHQEYQLPL